MLAKKTWRIVAIRQIRQSFLPAKVLFYTVADFLSLWNHKCDYWTENFSLKVCMPSGSKEFKRRLVHSVTVIISA